jgi:prepilin-type N-terminal cleavage/methylation domain-containing protein
MVMMTLRPLHTGCRTKLRLGFTLVELLVVIACVAIAGMLVVPMAGNTESSRLRSAARQVVADLQYAQMRAMGNGLDGCMVVFSPTEPRYHLASRTDPAQPINHPSDRQPYVTHFGQGRVSHLKGVTITGVSVGGDQKLGFTTLGALDQGTAATIDLRCGSSTLRITLNPTTGDATIE